MHARKKVNIKHNRNFSRFTEYLCDYIYENK